METMTKLAAACSRKKREPKVNKDSFRELPKLVRYSSCETRRGFPASVFSDLDLVCVWVGLGPDSWMQIVRGAGQLTHIPTPLSISFEVDSKTSLQTCSLGARGSSASARRTSRRRAAAAELCPVGADELSSGTRWYEASVTSELNPT